MSTEFDPISAVFDKATEGRVFKVTPDGESLKGTVRNIVSQRLETRVVNGHHIVTERGTGRPAENVINEALAGDLRGSVATPAEIEAAQKAHATQQQAQQPPGPTLYPPGSPEHYKAMRGIPSWATLGMGSFIPDHRTAFEYQKAVEAQRQQQQADYYTNVGRTPDLIAAGERFQAAKAAGAANVTHQAFGLRPLPK